MHLGVVGQSIEIEVEEYIRQLRRPQQELCFRTEVPVRKPVVDVGVDARAEHLPISRRWRGGGCLRWGGGRGAGRSRGMGSGCCDGRCGRLT